LPKLAAGHYTAEVPTGAVFAVRPVSGACAMNKIWKTIRGYIWWTYSRGSLHYDVMVTLILLFIFIAPRYISFNDKPTERTLHQSKVIVSPDPHREGVLICQVDASAIAGKDVEAELLSVIEPIAGEVVLNGYDVVKDQRGRVILYKAYVQRR
jgi:hypothetical protein